MPFANVLLPRLDTKPLRATRVQVRQALFKHDVAVFDVPDLAGLGRKLKRDAPVRIDWGHDKTTATFYGYVQSIQTTQVASQRSAPNLRVTCIAASRVFAMRRQRAWRGSYALIAQDIAKLGKLRAAAEPSQGKVALNQRAMSDWDFLLSMAKTTGRIVYCNGLTLNFVTKNFWLEKEGRNAPILEMGASVSKAGALTRFQPRTTNSDPSAPRGRFGINVIDPRTKKVRVVEGVGQVTGPSRDDVGKGRTKLPVVGTAASEAEARDRVRALEELSRYVHKAKVEATGHARVHQGRPVYLKGVPPDLLGYWIVASAVHTITGAAYRMELELHTDSTGASIKPPPGEQPVVPVEGDEAYDPGIEFATPEEQAQFDAEYGAEPEDGGVSLGAQEDGGALEDIGVEPPDPETDPPSFGEDELNAAMEKDDDLEVPVVVPDDDDFSWVER